MTHNYYRNLVTKYVLKLKCSNYASTLADCGYCYLEHDLYSGTSRGTLLAPLSLAKRMIYIKLNLECALMINEATSMDKKAMAATKLC